MVAVSSCGSHLLPFRRRIIFECSRRSVMALPPHL
jgi:hypothetical protein